MPLNTNEQQALLDGFVKSVSFAAVANLRGDRIDLLLEGAKAMLQSLSVRVSIDQEKPNGDDV